MHAIFLIAAFILVPSLAGAFPDNGVLETFTGSDGTTPINASWGNSEIRTNSSGCNIRSNAAAPNNTNNNGCYWLSAFSADSEAYLTIVNVGSTALWAPCVRIQSPSSNTATNTTDAYCAEFEDATDTITLVRIDNTAATTLGSPIASGGQITVGDKVGVTAIGDQICAWWNDDGGGWVNMGCQTDATYASGGFIGFYINGSATVGGADDFGGGDIAGTPPPSVRHAQPTVFR